MKARKTGLMMPKERTRMKNKADTITEEAIPSERHDWDDYEFYFLFFTAGFT
jgi:hypothetical protein